MAAQTDENEHSEAVKRLQSASPREVIWCSMRLTTTDRRFIAEVTELETSKDLGTAPVEFSANVSSEGARALRENAAPFYRAEDGDSRFTLTIDKVTDLRIVGTIRRR